MRLPKLLMTALLSVGLAAPAVANFRDTSVPMKAVDVNLKKYVGKWYEIARYPNRFERGCTGVTANYGLQADGNVSVLNTCVKGDGSNSRSAEARPVGPGKLKVNFVKWLPAAEGDYWVLYVDPRYNLAVVGEPSGKFGWVLSRSPQIRQSEYDKALSVLRANGYDTSQIQLVPQ